MRFPWLVLVSEEMEVAGLFSLQRKPYESNALCFGGTLWPMSSLDDTTQREPERPFHSLSCRKNQASPFHLEREDQPSFLGAKTGKAYSTLIGRIIRSSWVFFGWDICSSLSSSFGVLTACSAKCHETQASLSQSLVQVRPTTDTRFLNHSFSRPHGS